MMNDDPMYLGNLDSVTRVDRVDPDTLVVEGIQGGNPVTRRLTRIDEGNGYYNITRAGLDTWEGYLRARVK